MHFTQKTAVLGLFLSLFLFIACGSEAPADTNSKTDTTGQPSTDTEVPVPAETTPQTYNSMEAFWPAFQRDLTTMDVTSLSPKIAFPLKGAQFLIGKPGQDEGASKADFVAEPGKIFDKDATDKILNSSYSDLEKMQFNVSDYTINGLDPNGYRLTVNYDMEEETESTLLYFFGKTPVGYKLIGIDFAG